MYRLVLVSLLLGVACSSSLSDVHQQCMNENSDAFSSDNLIGTWYHMYRLTFIGMVPSISCIAWNFTKPTADVLQQYKDRYNDPNVPYSLDDDPVLVADGYLHKDGLYAGHNIAKFFVINWNTSMAVSGGYNLEAFRQLTPKYIMYTDWSLRGHSRALLSNDRNAPVAEMEQIIKDTPELSRLDKQRFCATY